MLFFDKFTKKKAEYDEEYYADDDYRSIDFEKSSSQTRDPSARQEYVRNCLEEMRIASDEMDSLQNEYAIVTSYLTDMEEIDAIPKDERRNIEEIASKLRDLRLARDTYILKENTMTEQEYNRMENFKDDAAEVLKKVEAEEDYRDKIKKDLKRLDREKRSYEYRKHELGSDINNYRSISIVSMVAAASLVIVLFLLQMLLNMDVSIGYYITVVLVAVALTFLYVKYIDSVKEKRRVDNTYYELILLENKVKIRYVNNQNLLDYYYLKYDIESGAELRSLYDRYVVEREERRRYETNESAYLEEMARLVRSLRKYRIKDPDIWVHQAEALVDNREMVEIRHKLIGRRQKLRKQMEYNETIAREASDEIKKMMNKYPSSKNTIMSMIEAYEKGTLPMTNTIKGE